MSKIKITIALIFSALFAAAQTKSKDKIIIGLNDETTIVDAPDLNQKTSILIKDSTYDYRVDIYKVEKSEIEGSQNFSLRNSAKKRKYFETTYFGQVEAGLNLSAIRTPMSSTIPNSQAILLDSFNFINSGPYESFNSYFSKTNHIGFYLDYTIRERTRPLLSSPKYYIKKSSNLRLDYNKIDGQYRLEKKYNFGNYSDEDSLISTATGPASFTTTHFQIIGKYSLGMNLNKNKNLSMDLGIAPLLQFQLSKNVDLPDYLRTTYADGLYYAQSGFTIRATMRVMAGINYNQLSLVYNLSLANDIYDRNAQYVDDVLNYSLGVKYRLK